MNKDTPDSHAGGLTRLLFAYCPECLARIDLDCRPALGRVITCECCTAVLRIADLNPLQLDWAAEMATDSGNWDWEVEVEPA